MGEAKLSPALSRDLDTDGRCAACRTPAGVLRVSRNFKPNDLSLAIVPQAEVRVRGIKVTCTLGRHTRFVPQHLLQEESKP